MLLTRPALALAAVVLAACAIGVGDISINDGNEIACARGAAPALLLEGRLSDDPAAERVQLTYALVVDGSESQLLGLLPIAIPVTDATALMVDYTDERTRTTLCRGTQFDTTTDEGERRFVVRMLRERDQEVLAEGRFSIMMEP
jgi:hypothetical protein